jgi:two-component system, NtrC family, response regulator GlrR
VRTGIAHLQHPAVERNMEAHESSTVTLLRATPYPLGALIRALGAPATPAAFRLTAGRCVVGSSSSCDVAVADPTVSRAHVELSLVPDGVAVQDLGSRNGTFYLDQRVERMTLGLGGRIRIGGATVAVEADIDSLTPGSGFDGDLYRGVLGASAAMRRLFATLVRLEGSLVTVLVEGESGTGKEVIARALHEGSSVAGGPLVTLNCGGIPRDLIASELFGHKRGAFTGAAEARRGAFEAADGGTLFLDEVAELPIEVQPMLLRALESGEVRTVGEDRTRRVRVRVVAATHRDLGREVEAGRFREDLFYRLAVVRLTVPPLRERREDIAPLARRFGEAVGLASVPEIVVEQLKARAWPGNARELRNAVQAYAALGVLPESGRPKGAVLDLSLGELCDVTKPYGPQKDALFERFTRIYLEALMAHTGRNQTAAARLAGLDRTYLGKLLVKHGLHRG